MRLPITAVVVASLLLSGGAPAAFADATPQTYRPELEYLKVVNSAGPAADPQIIFLLMGQYLNANRLLEGIDFFEAFLARHGAALQPGQKSLYQLRSVCCVRHMRTTFSFLSALLGSRTRLPFSKKPDASRTMRFSSSVGVPASRTRNCRPGSTSLRRRSMTSSGACASSDKARFQASCVK
jgi:hypothetical protein